MGIGAIGKTILAPAGSFVFGPKGIPHTFIVSSGKRASCSSPSPPASSSSCAPSASRPHAAAAGFGIEITGPPGIPA